MGDMDELVAWIREQLDERERVALGAINQGGRGRAGEGTWTQCDPERRPGLIGDMAGGVVTYDEGAPNEYRAAHIVLNDPDAVLREVKATRLMLDEHGIIERKVGWLETDEDGSKNDFEAKLPVCRTCVPKYAYFESREAVPTGPCRTVKLMAVPFDARPGYRPEWAPSDA